MPPNRVGRLLMPPAAASSTPSLLALPNELLFLILSFLFASSTVPRYQLQELQVVFGLRPTPNNCTAVFRVCRTLHETAWAVWYQHIEFRLEELGDINLRRGSVPVFVPLAPLPPPQTGLQRLRYLDLAPRPFGVLMRHAQHVNPWLRLAAMLPELRRLIIRPVGYQTMVRSIPGTALQAPAINAPTRNYFRRIWHLVDDLKANGLARHIPYPSRVSRTDPTYHVRLYRFWATYETALMTIIAINLYQLRSGGSSHMYYISSLTGSHPANTRALGELNDLAIMKQTTTSGIRHLEIKLGMQYRLRNRRWVTQVSGHYWDLINEWFWGEPIPNASAS
ncbi:hypothetical protein LTR67_000413 [Exophiala xenobiotica]